MNFKKKRNSEKRADGVRVPKYWVMITICRFSRHTLQFPNKLFPATKAELSFSWSHLRNEKLNVN